MFMSIPMAKKVLESLEELVVDSDNIDFGPAIAMAQQRQQEAIRITRAYIKTGEAILASNPRKALQ